MCVQNIKTEEASVRDSVEQCTLRIRVSVMVCIATFNNISVIL